MKCPPPDVRPEELIEALDAQWRLRVDGLDFVPKGAGASHWTATTRDGRPWFLTCDDLDSKPWLGSDRDSVSVGLNAAYRVALRLRRRAGLTFVVAPVPSGNGEPTARLDARHTLAVFPYLNGIAGRWGEPVDPGERERVLELLAELHGAGAVAQALPRRSSDIAGRPDLETALGEFGQAQEAGPYSEPVRKELQSSKDRVLRWLREFDETALGLASAATPPVLTHGEPHPGNLIKGSEGFSLIDWDTVAMDRPERDLWMLDDGTSSVVDAYEGLTGRRVEAEALVLYRRAWALADLAAYIAQLRRPHDDNEDSAKAWNAIISILRSEEPRPYGGPAPEP